MRDSGWDEFTDEQLSMVLSVLAGGGQLCCKGGLAAAYTIARNRRQREFLAEFGYDRLGCCHTEPDYKYNAYDWQAYYLEKAEHLISDIGPMPTCRKKVDR